MDLLQWESNPWGQEILVRISWNLLWAAAIAGIVFIVAHLVFRRTHVPRIRAAAAAAPRPSGEGDAVPDRIPRHSSAARAFHWIMALSMFALLITAFFPVLGIQFAWVTVHWAAGLVLIASILFHIGHSVVRGTWRQVWVSRADLVDLGRRFRRALGRPTEEPARDPKYPLPNKLYHHAVVVTSVLASATGLLMMVRVETPFWARNPYLLQEQTWGWVYVVHGLSAVGLVTLVMAHVYFAVLPEKRWITKSMIRGWIKKDDYLEHHDPQRWPMG